MNWHAILNRITRTCLLFAVGHLILIDVSIADIVRGTVTSGPTGSAFQELTPPFSAPKYPGVSRVGANSFDTDNLYGFNEVQNIRLTSDVDAGNPSGKSGDRVTIKSGTLVSSHLVFFDPATDKTVVGNIFFDRPILGVIYQSPRLDTSDARFKSPSVTYYTHGNRGLEGQDAYSVIGTNQLRVNFSAGNPGDQVRVITAATPEASVLLMTLCSCVCAVLFARRRKTQKTTNSSK